MHIMLGASDYTRTKTQERSRYVLKSEPIAKLVKLGLANVSSECNNETSNILFSKRITKIYVSWTAWK